VAYTHKVGQVA